MARCCTCGQEHADSECSGVMKCCLCGEAHSADSLSCVARAQEESIVEIIEKRRCSRGEAVAIVKERAVTYAGVTSKQAPLTDTALSSMMDAAAEKAVAKHVEPLVLTMTQCLAQMQLLTAKLTEFLQALPVLSVSPHSRIPEAKAVPLLPPTLATSTAQGRQNTNASGASPYLNASAATLESDTNLPAPQSSSPTVLAAQVSPPSSDDSSSDMELGITPSQSKNKRTLSPADLKINKGPKSKTKKGVTRTSKSGDILKQAIASAELESP